MLVGADFVDEKTLSVRCSSPVPLGVAGWEGGPGRGCSHAATYKGTHHGKTQGFLFDQARLVDLSISMTPKNERFSNK